MEHIFAIFFGVILVIINLLTLSVMIGKIKRMISCTKKIVAKVTSVQEEIDKDEDSETGKVKYKYSYRVTFKYDYNGNAYESEHTYNNHCRYCKNSNTEIKINPHKPKESWTKGELKDVLAIALFIPVLLFLNYLYIITVF